MKNNSKIRSAVVGYGKMHNFGRMHSTWIRENPFMELYAICDRDETRTKQAQLDFPGVKVSNDLDMLLREPELDMITLVTPNFTHKDLAIKAYEYGKHVLTENAMCLTTDEATEMIRAAGKAEKMLCVHHNRRHDGNYRRVKQIVESGEIGEVFHIELSPGGYAHPFPGQGGHWWADMDRSGGSFYYYGPQAIDWLLDLVPHKITDVTGYSHKLVWDDMTDEDQVRAIIRFENGAVADFTNSHIDSSPKPFWRILGTKGAIIDTGENAMTGYEKEVCHPSSGKLRLVKMTKTGRTEQEVPYLDSDWHMFYRDIASHLMKNTPVPIDGEVGRRVIGVLQAAKRSCTEHRSIIPEYR